MNIRNDEPTDRDHLGREAFAASLAHIARTAEAPLVVGLYGRWGVGKTSLLKLVAKELEGDTRVRTVWFDAWQHQFDEHPAVALLHTLTRGDAGVMQAAKKTLFAVSRALGDITLRLTTPLKIDDVERSLEAYEEQNFQVREARVRLFENFKEIVERAQGQGDAKKRLVFLIDDLDRCLPENILRVLEALKLYLNLPGCTYLLAVDKAAVEASIRGHYKDTGFDEVQYLDKIIQLPFSIPPIDPKAMDSYVKSLLPVELASCREILRAALPRNPRSVKRFVNTLLLNHHLAENSIDDVDPKLLTVLLLMQYRNAELYGQIAAQPEILFGDPTVRAKELSDHAVDMDLLAPFLDAIDRPDPETLGKYIHLTSVTGVGRRDTLDERGFHTERGLDEMLITTNEIRAGEKILEHLLLFQTERQQTWLVTSDKRLFCFLDDEKTRAGNTELRWSTELAVIDREQIRARRSNRGNMVIDLDRRAPWLYSTHLHNDPEELADRVKAMIEDALSS